MRQASFHLTGSVRVGVVGRQARPCACQYERADLPPFQASGVIPATLATAIRGSAFRRFRRPLYANRLTSGDASLQSP